MATPFTGYTGSNTSTTLTNALLAPNSGISVIPNSILLKASASTSVNFYDGSLLPLGIGAGLLLTSGYAPGTVNTIGWDGTDNSWNTGFNNGDADIDAVVNTVFQTQSYDATTLSFDFTVADPSATSISFDLVFGSEEYPEWVDQFVDSAIVMVNGVNYALFNHDPNHPLSVVTANLNAGYFQNNAGGILPIQYDGVSHVLKIVAPINSGGVTNHIKIGIADTGDHIYDSGIFIANMVAGNIPGSGVVITPPDSGTDNSDNLTGSSKDEYFDLKGGDDVCYAGAGDDIIVAGAGNDAVYGGSGADEMKGDAGDDILDGGIDSDTVVYAGSSSEYSVVYNAISNNYTITDSKSGATAEGMDTLTNVELAKFSDGLFALNASGLTPVTDPIVAPSNTPGSVVISGIGSVGSMLTASVSDPDGISGAVSYQWQAFDGTNWNNIGNNSNTYTVSLGDVDKDIQVLASYVDNGSNAETPVSAPKTIIGANNGDLVVTLIQLNAPLGASNINPLTTLMQNAIDLGLTPNEAALGIKAVLGLPSGINLQNYDAYAALLVDPNDPIAAGVEKVAVQVAILTSLSDDESAMNMTLNIIDAIANNQTLDLANVGDLSQILDIPAIVDPITGKYPQPLDEIFDRNKSMSDAVDDILNGGGAVGDTGLSVIEREWQDLLSIQDNINSTSIADLSIHVNQAPTGNATANLIDGTQDTAYLINASDLLMGFTDSDGGVLQISGLTADNGGLQDNLDGTWTFTPNPNYTGPVELNFMVNDGQGGSISASQMLVISAIPETVNNNAPLIVSASVNPATVTTTTVNYTGTLAFTDADAPDTHSSSPALTIGSAGGSLSTVLTEASNAGDVDWSYTYSLPVTFGSTIQSKTDSFDITVTDNHGGTAAHSILISVGTGTAAANSLTGTAGIDILLGGAGNDTLNGSEGNDVLIGGLGNDTYIVNGNDSLLVEKASEGTDLVKSSFDYLLADNFENLTLLGTAITGTGNSLNNVITGTINDNILDGGTGNDTLKGDFGDDTYIVDSSADKITEVASAGIDTAQSIVAYTLAANVENLVLTGAANINGTGNTLANMLTGNGGNNILNGGAGADIMIGSSGNDTYVIDDASDAVNEEFGKGTDLVKSSLDYSLGENVENLTLTGTAINGVGNNLNNILTGNAGNNILDGGVGNDTLKGGLGDDSYVVDSSTDKITEALNAGVDTVQSSAASYVLAPNVENLVLTGTGNINGSGNAVANMLIGNDGSNTLKGMDGNDTINGGSGNDLLVGGKGLDILNGGNGVDIFWFDSAKGATNVDTIGDFLSGTDMLQFSKTAAGLTTMGVVGHFSELDARFEANSTGIATTDAARLIYNSNNGELSYDSDGNGNIAAVPLVTLTSGSTPVAADIWLV
ncbi:MAG: choice-of-anchor L domain-containing protein [Methylobacter sp.]